MRQGALFVGSLAAILAVSHTAQARPLLAVSAEAAGEIVLVDPVKAEVVERIKLGPRPRGLKLSPDKRRLLVALAGAPKPAASPAARPAPAPAGELSAGLAIIDVPTRKIAKHVATAPAPFGVDISPDGRTGYLSNNDTNEVFTIDLATGSLRKTHVGREPRGVAVRADGAVVYVATYGADEVSAIDARTISFLGRIDAGSKPQGVVLAPAGGTAVVAGEGLPSVTVLDTKRNEFKAQFFVHQEQALGAPPPALQSAVFAPDGKRLYLTTGPGRSVMIVDPAKKVLVGSIADVGSFPRGIAISRDGKKLYTANGPSNDVAIIDIRSKKVEARIAVPGAPWGIVLLP
jgi:YVTN family beta-propeller protein